MTDRGAFDCMTRNSRAEHAGSPALRAEARRLVTALTGVSGGYPGYALGLEGPHGSRVPTDDARPAHGGACGAGIAGAPALMLPLLRTAANSDGSHFSTNSSGVGNAKDRL